MQSIFCAMGIADSCLTCWIYLCGEKAGCVADWLVDSKIDTLLLTCILISWPAPGLYSYSTGTIVIISGHNERGSVLMAHRSIGFYVTPNAVLHRIARQQQVHSQYSNRIIVRDNRRLINSKGYYNGSILGVFRWFPLQHTCGRLCWIRSVSQPWNEFYPWITFLCANSGVGLAKHVM